MTDLLDFDFAEAPPQPPAGNPDRFTGRWRLTGAGLSNVWRYGDLDLQAPSGRLLLRGQNGTGKTTALEALWPYLLDLDAARLGAGRARSTTLKQLMSDGAPERGRRYGYAWLTFAPPAAIDEPPAVTYGVRLQFSPTSSPAVIPVPFTVPGRPLHDLSLTGPGGSAVEHDEFRRRVEELGGEVFAELDEYVDSLSRRVWNTTPQDLRDLAQRMRQVRNPALLGDLSPAAAADALRESLPGVADEAIAETAEALAESEATRQAFERDRIAADALQDFLQVWTGYVADAAKTTLGAAQRAAAEARRLEGELARIQKEAEAAETLTAASEAHAADLDGQHAAADAEVQAIERSEEYKAAGRSKDLERTLSAQQAAARTTADSLLTRASGAARDTRATRAVLDSAIERLGRLLTDAADAGAPARTADELLTHHPRVRAVRRAGDTVADPGSGVTIRHNSAAMEHLAEGWTAQAATHRADAGTAAMLIADFAPVHAAAEAHAQADAALEDAETRLGTERRLSRESTARARKDATALLTASAGWTGSHQALRAVDPDDQAAGYEWDAEDVAALENAEPAAVLAAADSWASHAAHAAERLAAGHESAARGLRSQADTLDAEAAELANEAQALRAGKLLPLPRPAWSGDGDDSAALGTVLEWLPGVDDDERERLELAMAASGILGAHLQAALDQPQAVTATWQVTATGPRAASSLTEVLTVDAAHPAAAAALAVLERIGLADSAGTAETGTLVIGRDGTFAAGPALGDPAGEELNARGALPPAQHVGARTRLEQARAEAERLDSQAAALIQEAQNARGRARDEQDAAKAVRAEGQTFPSRTSLRSSEAERSVAAQRLTEAQELRDSASRQAAEAAEEHRTLRLEWVDRARSLNMPPDTIQLSALAEDRRKKAGALEQCAAGLRKLNGTTLPQLLADIVDEDLIDRELGQAEIAAQQAHTEVRKTHALLDESRRDSDPEDTLRRYENALSTRNRLDTDRKTASGDAREHRTAAIQAHAKIDPARETLGQALPARSETAARLTTLLRHPAVAAALDIDRFLVESGRDLQDGLGDGDALLEAAAELLARKPTSAWRTLVERYDTTRAELAQTWTLAMADAPDGIDVQMFVLTHAEDVYDLPQAARRASELATQAQQALEGAESAAIDRFVIGRLPTAIGTAWSGMETWKKEVNAKMRAARASSGVGVQVRITLRDDLDAWTHAVYQLSCVVGDAVRTDEQKRQVGQAITSLLDAADGETMTERLTKAIDITTWVDVKYLVERPGKDTPEPWGSRTPLSGGERRLVVLAPMLAAIAANYDQLGAGGLRLVPLDEVPAEVDEQGREGLARYMAALDLDLLCTSYLWDGAPGAWDGVDAYDLESGSDGTVVALPMLIRGLQPLPGDADATDREAR